MANLTLTLVTLALCLSSLELEVVEVFISVQTHYVAVHTCLELGSRLIVVIAIALHVTNERLLALLIAAVFGATLCGVLDRRIHRQCTFYRHQDSP